MLSYYLFFNVIYDFSIILLIYIIKVFFSDVRIMKKILKIKFINILLAFFFIEFYN